MNNILHLSQSNLQDFSDCPRRFQLKAIDNIEWPAPAIEPLSLIERSTELGNKFHQLGNQFFSGIPKARIEGAISDPDLRVMWDEFAPFAETLLSLDHHSELILTAPYQNHQLIAKYDLLVNTADDGLIIFDWKTARKKPPRSILANKIQTKFYPLVLVLAGGNIFNSNPIKASDITLRYWYPLSEDPAEYFSYSDDIHQENLTLLEGMVSEIDSLVENKDIFPLTDDRELCEKCVFRSLCDRGAIPGTADQFLEIDQEDLSSSHFDFDLINEVEF